MSFSLILEKNLKTWCDTVIYNEKYLVFILVSGTELLKTLELPKCKGAFCSVNKVTFGKHPGMGTGCQRNQPCDCGNFQSYFLTSGEGRGAANSVTNGQWFNQSCLCKEASLKPKRDRVRRVSKLANMWIFEESGVPEEGIEAPRPFPIFHLAVPKLYPFKLSW